MGIAVQLLTEPWAVVGLVVSGLQHPGNLVMLGCTIALGVFQLVQHTFHPPQVAIFGGKPRVVMTSDHVAPEFAELRGIFLKQLTSGQDLAAQYVVYWRGKKVVDLCAGQQYVKSIAVESTDPDDSSTATYGPNTLQLCWSAKEVLAPLAVALAQDRGWLQYDEAVAKYWPEFGANGKADITVAQLMRHDGGLWALEPPLCAVDFADPVLLAQKLAAARPASARDSGGASTRCHHTYTRDCICAELIRRVDPAGRALDQLLRAEIFQHLRLELEGGLVLGTEQPMVGQRNVKGSANQPSDGDNNTADAGRAGALDGLKIAPVLLPPNYRIRLAELVQGGNPLPVHPWLGRSGFAPLGGGQADLDWPAQVDWHNATVILCCEREAGGWHGPSLASARALAKVAALLAGGGTLAGRRLLKEKSVDRALGGTVTRIDSSCGLSTTMTQAGWGRALPGFRLDGKADAFYHEWSAAGGPSAAAEVRGISSLGDQPCISVVLGTSCCPVNVWRCKHSLGHRPGGLLLNRDLPQAAVADEGGKDEKNALFGWQGRDGSVVAWNPTLEVAIAATKVGLSPVGKTSTCRALNQKVLEIVSTKHVVKHM